MTSVLTFLASLLFHLVLYGLLLFCVKKINMSSEQRFLQTYFVAANLVVAFFGLLTYRYVLLLINKLMQIEILFSIVTLLFPGNSFKLGFMLFVFDFTNILYLLVMIIVKLYTKSKIWNLVAYPDSKIHYPFKFVANRYYTIDDPREGEYVIRDDKVILGKWIRGIQFAVIVVVAVELVLASLELYTPVRPISVDVLGDIMRKAFLLPTVTYGIFAEVSYFLQGDLSVKPELELESDNLQFKLLNNYHLLYRALLSRFSGYVLYNEEVFGRIDVPVFEGISEKQKKIAREYSSQMEHLLDTVAMMTNRHSTQYENALYDLLLGQHVLVFDVLDGTVGPYVVAYLQLRLMQGQKIVIICHSEQSEQQMKEQLDETFHTINYLSVIWKIETSDSFLKDSQADILCCSLQDVSTESLFTRHKEFFGQVGLCLISCTEDFMNIPKHIQDMFRNHLNAVSNNPQYLFVSEQRARQTELAVERYLGGIDIGSYTSDEDRNCAGLIVWKAEGKPQNELQIYGEVNIGMAMSLMLASEKHGVKNIYIYGPDEPIRAYRENLTALQDQVNGYLGQQSSTLEVLARTPRAIFHNEELTFTIVFDRLNHLTRTVELWKNFGGTQYAMLNVVSKPYMLRDYLADNMEYGTSSLKKAGDLSAIFPSFNRAVQADLITLLFRMYESGVEETEVNSILYENNLREENIWDNLEQLVGMLVPGFVDNNKQVTEWFQISETAIFSGMNENENFISVHKVYLTEKRIYDILISRYKLAEGVIGNNQHCWLPCVIDDIENRYLPGQKITVGQQSYEVARITDDRQVLLKRLQNIDMTEVYQHRSFEIAVENDTSAMKTGDVISIQRVEGSATRHIRGFTTLYNGVSVANTSDYSTVKFADPIITKYENRHMLRIVLNNLDGAEKSAAYITFSAMLSELMKTLFPLSWQDIVVLTPEIGNAPPEAEGDDNSRRAEQTIWSLFPAVNSDIAEGVYVMELTHEESRIDLTLEDSENWHNVVYILFGYLEWLLKKQSSEKEKPGTKPGLDKQTDDDKKKAEKRQSYLQYGLSDDPSFFDFDAVYNLLQQVVSEDVKETGTETSIITGMRCCFCGEPIIGNGIRIESNDPNRIMCENCNAHAVRQIDEISKLYVKARRQMQSHYMINGRPIELPARISVKFKSAKNIRNKLKSPPGERVLGFYNPRSRELWIERGGPSAFTMATIYHELTHAWQFHSHKVKNVKLLQRNNLKILEGQAVYVEIECLKQIGQNRYAKKLEEQYRAIFKSTPGDPYGDGFALYDSNMPYSPSDNAFDALACEEPLQWQLPDRSS